MKRLQRSAQRLQIVRAEFLAALLRWHLQRQVQVGRTARAHLRGQVHGQRANHGVAALHLGRVQVWHMAVKRGAALLHPLQGAGVAADEPGGHAVWAWRARVVWGGWLMP